MLFRSNYLVTAFDSALYYIPEFPFVAGGDTVFSYSLSLKVLTVPVDTTSQEIVINDIKPIVEPPINWRSLITKIAIGVVVFAILLVVVLLVVRHLRKRKMQPIIVEKIPERVKTCDSLEHSPGQRAGLAMLSVLPAAAQGLQEALGAQGWRVVVG